MVIPSLLLPDSALAQESELAFENDPRAIVMEIVVLEPTTQCPLCGQLATRIHSHYGRSLADLPWADIPVRISLRVRRFHCDNPVCRRKIFCERVLNIAAPWARRTQRLTAAQAQIGLRAGGVGGAELGLALHMPAGRDVLLTLVRQLAVDAAPTPRVLGVDDWAMRKGHTYGTILVDLERGCIIGLLPDRTPETLAAWLRAHPGIEIVSRDRAEAYADGISQGAPEAIQVADRWHLLHNLAHALYQFFQQEHTLVEHSLAPAAPAPSAASMIAAGDLPSESERLPSAADQQRQKRAETVQQLHGQGWTQVAIAAHLALATKTVRRYLRTPLPLSPQRRTRDSLLDAHKPYLIERWNGGCHNAAQLGREIAQRGFTGRLSIVRLFTGQLRKAAGLPPRTRSAAGRPLTTDPSQRPPTLRGLTWLVLHQPETLEEREEAYVARVGAASSRLDLAIRLTREFTELVRQRQADKLDGWLAAAADSGISKLAQFAAGLRRDYAAVHAALSLNWSNGPTEGHINRLKCLKRQMYGRAKLDLLGRRLMAA
jgi:transposase